MNKSKIFRSGLLFLSLFFIVAALSACATPGSSNIDAPLTLDDADNGYLIMPGDKLHVTVYGDDVMSKDFVVGSNGKVALPLLGQTKVKGMTADDAEAMIMKALKKRGMMTSANVTVDANNPRPIYVMGEVKLAGTYPYQSAMSAMQAVATAGGYTARAAQNKLLIDRKIDDKIVRMNGIENTPLLPGDTIVVRERIF